MDLITNVADGLAQLATAVAPPLPELTDEAVTAILMQLPLSQLPSCAAACSQWARCVRSDGLLWSAGFASRFGGTVSPADARQACRRCFSALSTLNLQPVVGAESGRGRVGLRPRAGAAVGSLGTVFCLLMCVVRACAVCNLARRPPTAGAVFRVVRGSACEKKTP